VDDDKRIARLVSGLPQSEPIERRRQGTFGWAVPYGGALRVIAKDVDIRYRPYASNGEWTTIPAGERIHLATGGPYEFQPEECEVHYVCSRADEAA
jgi:hypothetical protein